MKEKSEMKNLRQEMEDWEKEANIVTDELLNEMCKYYGYEEEEDEVEIKEIPLSLDFGELKNLGYDY